MVKKVLFLFLLATALCSFSCTNYLNLNEAQSLGKRNVALQVEGQGSIVRSTSNGALSSVELLYKRGLSKSVDLGYYLNSNLEIGLHSKFQLIDGEKNDLAIGIDGKLPVLDYRFSRLSPTVYYTKSIGKSKILVNPSILIRPAFFNNSIRYEPNITLGAQFGNLPFRLGYNFSFESLPSNRYIHTIGISYNFYFSPEKKWKIFGL